MNVVDQTALIHEELSFHPEFQLNRDVNVLDYTWHPIDNQTAPECLSNGNVTAHVLGCNWIGLRAQGESSESTRNKQAAEDS